MTLTPLMSLNVPTIGIDSGLTWENALNANSSILDGHNHSPGSGSPINSNGIQINSDLAFNGFNAISLKSSRYSIQTVPIPASGSDLGCTYVSGVDLYYNDVNGNQIQITSGGLVNATSSGISSGTASASFSSSVLVVNAASNTPANIKCASIVMGNTGVSGSHYVTISPVAALAANYNLVLPAIPAQTNVVTIDNSGTMASITYDAVGVGMTATGANAIANTRSRATGSSTEGVGGVPTSSSSGTFTSSSGPFVDVTNLSVTLTTNGRPVYISLLPDGSAYPAVCVVAVVTNPVILSFVRGSTSVAQSQVTTVNGGFAPSCFSFVDIVAAGTYTYKVQVSMVSTGTVSITRCILMAFEL